MRGAFLTSTPADRANLGHDNAKSRNCCIPRSETLEQGQGSITARFLYVIWRKSRQGDTLNTSALQPLLPELLKKGPFAGTDSGIYVPGRNHSLQIDSSFNPSDNLKTPKPSDRACFPSSCRSYDFSEIETSYHQTDLIRMLDRFLEQIMQRFPYWVPDFLLASLLPLHRL